MRISTALLALFLSCIVHADPAPLFADFMYQYPAYMKDFPARGGKCEDLPPVEHSVYQYSPVPHVGGLHGGPRYDNDAWYGWFALCYGEQRAAAGVPIVLMVRNYNCPFPYGGDVDTRGDPTALKTSLDALPRVDYVLMDLEGDAEDVARNIQEVSRMVRAHPNPAVRSAFIGNYADTACTTDERIIWPDLRDRTNWNGSGWDRSAWYSEFLNVSMPVCYPYESASRLCDIAIQGDTGVCPNPRAAEFWSALESFSSAKRVLPAGHKIIPWVSPYVPYVGNDPRNVYNAPLPPLSDLRSLLVHMRLRGADDGFYVFDDWGKAYPPYDSYAGMALDLWKTLDIFRKIPGKREVLTLDTHKTTGVEWSGVRVGNVVTIFVTNLSGENAEVSVPGVKGVFPCAAGGYELYTVRER